MNADIHVSRRESPNIIRQCSTTKVVDASLSMRGRQFGRWLGFYFISTPSNRYCWAQVLVLPRFAYFIATRTCRRYWSWRWWAGMIGYTNKAAFLAGIIDSKVGAVGRLAIRRHDRDWVNDGD